jgi:hypothetical protein
MFRLPLTSLKKITQAPKLKIMPVTLELTEVASQNEFVWLKKLKLIQCFLMLMMMYSLNSNGKKILGQHMKK